MGARESGNKMAKCERVARRLEVGAIREGGKGGTKRIKRVGLSLCGRVGLQLKEGRGKY